MQCPTCGAVVEADAFWCDRCATRLRAPVDAEHALVGAPRPPDPAPAPDPTPAPSAWGWDTKPVAPPEHVHTPRPRTTSNAKSIATVLLVMVAFLATLNLARVLNEHITARRTPAPAPVALHDGNLFLAPDSSFSVRFPTAPQAIVTGSMRVTWLMSVAPFHSIGSTSGDRVFSLQWIDLPPTGMPDLLALRRSLCASSTVTARRPRGQERRHCRRSGRAVECVFRQLAFGTRYQEIVLQRGSRLYLFATHSRTTEGISDFLPFVQSFKPLTNG